MKIHFQKIFHNNTMKDNMTVTSSNFSYYNDFDPFLAKSHSKLPIADKKFDTVGFLI